MPITTEADDKFCDIFLNFLRKGMVFHEFRLPEDDTHEMPYPIWYFWKSIKIWKCRLLKMIGGALWVNLTCCVFIGIVRGCQLCLYLLFLRLQGVKSSLQTTINRRIKSKYSNKDKFLHVSLDRQLMILLNQPENGKMAMVSYKWYVMWNNGFIFAIFFHIPWWASGVQAKSSQRKELRALRG